VQEALFLDVSKSQASRFYEEVGEDGVPVLRPPAGSEGTAQLVGLADHVVMRVCITSKLPLPVKVCMLFLLHLHRFLGTHACAQFQCALLLYHLHF
jgi:hypothetical protein